MDSGAVLPDDRDNESELTPLVVASRTGASSESASLSSYYSFQDENYFVINSSSSNNTNNNYPSEHGSSNTNNNAAIILPDPDASRSIISYSNLGLSTLNRSRSITNSTDGTNRQHDQASYQASIIDYVPTNSSYPYQSSPVAGYQLNSLLGVNILHEPLSNTNNDNNDYGVNSNSNNIDDSSRNRGCLHCCCCTCGQCMSKVFSWSSIVTVVLIIQLVAIIFLRIDSVHNDKRYNGMINDLRKENNDLYIQSKAEYNNLFNRNQEELYDMIDKHERFEVVSYNMINKIYANVTAITDAMEYHDRQLGRLLNRTTNADVLDKLTVTESNIQHLVEMERQEVMEQIQLSTKNVSDKLAKSSRELSETQRLVDNHLDQSVQNMRHIVDTATMQIETVQSNVASQVLNISYHFNSVVGSLEGAVEEAKASIKQQVRVVKDDISEYVDITNRRFAAENDFVKYQLAGSAVGVLLNSGVV